MIEWTKNKEKSELSRRGKQLAMCKLSIDRYMKLYRKRLNEPIHIVCEFNSIWLNSRNSVEPKSRQTFRWRKNIYTRNELNYMNTEVKKVERKNRTKKKRLCFGFIGHWRRTSSIQNSYIGNKIKNKEKITRAKTQKDYPKPENESR